MAHEYSVLFALAIQLRRCWFDVFFWRRIVLARKCGNWLEIDRKGNLYLICPGAHPLRLSLETDDVSRKEFADAMDFAGAKARHFQKVITIVQESVPQGLYWFYVVIGYVRRSYPPFRAWLQKAR